MKLKFSISVILLFTLCSFCSAQIDTLSNYSQSLSKLDSLIKSDQVGDFKKAVFVVENTYTGNKLNYVKFNFYIDQLRLITQSWINSNKLNSYHQKDSLNVLQNCALFQLFTDTLKVLANDSVVAVHLPYRYDFNDFFGNKEWGNMFVIKLISSHEGNCHSLPYLYKILADELGATCWLGLAPNHMYIKNRCKSMGWYNTELTSRAFPIDAWIMGSGYIPLEAIQSGIYMDTLSNPQSIALCVLDLAKGYEHQIHNYTDGFILQCCDISLQYFPLNVQALLLKAETLKRIYGVQISSNPKRAKETYSRMEQVYARLVELGYREMPQKMYLSWLTSITKEQKKYSNQQVHQLVKPQ